MRSFLVILLSFFSLVSYAEMDKFVPVKEVVRFSIATRAVQFKDAAFEIETQDENRNLYRVTVPAAVELNQVELQWLMANPSAKLTIVHRVNSFREFESCLSPELVQQKTIRNPDGSIGTKDVCYVIYPSYVVVEQ